MVLKKQKSQTTSFLLHSLRLEQADWHQLNLPRIGTLSMGHNYFELKANEAFGTDTVLAD